MRQPIEENDAALRFCFRFRRMQAGAAAALMRVARSALRQRAPLVLRERRAALRFMFMRYAPPLNSYAIGCSCAFHGLTLVSRFSFSDRPTYA